MARKLTRTYFAALFFKGSLDAGFPYHPGEPPPALAKFVSRREKMTENKNANSDVDAAGSPYGDTKDCFAEVFPSRVGRAEIDHYRTADGIPRFDLVFCCYGLIFCLH